MKNRYYIRSRISEKKFREIVKFFVADLTAQQIACFCEKESYFDKGEIEIDESYFGARRIRGKRGRGARGKTIVFGLKKRDGKVYTQVITNCSKEEILPLIRSKINKETTLFTDGFKTYDSLVDLGYRKHYRVYHGKNEFSKKKGKVKNHINGIENFWGIAKVRLPNSEE